jgi:hypothetical protein
LDDGGPQKHGAITYSALTDKLVAQYDSYQHLPGAQVNGRLTSVLLDEIDRF